MCDMSYIDGLMILLKFMKLSKIKKNIIINNIKPQKIKTKKFNIYIKN